MKMRLIASQLILFFVLILSVCRPVLSGDIEDWMKEGLKALNQHRGDRPPLCLNKKLNRSAQLTAEWFTEGHPFDHNSVVGFADLIQMNDFTPQAASENLNAWQHFPDSSKTERFLHAIEVWKKSPGHNTNMLRPLFTHVGFGLAVKPNSPMQNYMVQQFAVNGEEACDYIIETGPTKRLKASSNDVMQIQMLKKRWLNKGLEETVRKNWKVMHRLPHDTSGYRKWIELGGSPAANKPPTPPKSPPTTTPSQPTCPRAAKLAAEMAKQEQKQGGCPFAKQASPNDLNKAIIEHDQNSAMGQQQSSAEGLQQRLLEPQMILLISGAIVALGLLWYFRGQLSGFIKSAYEKTLNWIFGVRKNQRIGTDKLSTGAKTMAKLVAKENPNFQPLQKDCSAQITRMGKINIPFQEFESLIIYALMDLNFHHLEILLENMRRIVKRDEIMRPRTNLLSTAKANAILDYITMSQVPSSLLESFILKSGHYLNGEGLSPQMRQVIKDKVALRHPIYQTSALILLGKYRLSPEEMKISVSTKYEGYVNPQFAQMVTKLVQNYFRPQRNLSLDRGTISQLKDAEIAMLEKLLKRTKCINPKIKSTPYCLTLVKTIQSFGPQITNRLQTISAPHLAYLLAVKDEQAYEDDLGMFMLAKETLDIPNSTRRVRSEAQLLRTLFSQKQRTIYPACRNPNSRTGIKTFFLPPKWKPQIEKLNVEIRRGFARALIYWFHRIPPYTLPRIRFTNNDLPSMFRDYLKAYCGQNNQIPAAAIVFLDKHPGKTRTIIR